MTYQGERARAMASEQGRCFEVSKIRLGADGHVSDLLWAEVGRADREVSARVLATAAEAVDAIHDGAQVAAVFPRLTAGPAGLAGQVPERVFVVVEHPDGRECIAFDDAPSPGRTLADLPVLDD
jgi:hypothetical protein